MSLPPVKAIIAAASDEMVQPGGATRRVGSVTAVDDVVAVDVDADAAVIEEAVHLRVARQSRASVYCGTAIVGRILDGVPLALEQFRPYRLTPLRQDSHPFDRKRVVMET